MYHKPLLVLSLLLLFVSLAFSSLLGFQHLVPTKIVTPSKLIGQNTVGYQTIYVVDFTEKQAISNFRVSIEFEQDPSMFIFINAQPYFQLINNSWDTSFFSETNFQSNLFDGNKVSYSLDFPSAQSTLWYITIQTGSNRYADNLSNMKAIGHPEFTLKYELEVDWVECPLNFWSDTCALASIEIQPQQFVQSNLNSINEMKMYYFDVHEPQDVAILILSENSQWICAMHQFESPDFNEENYSCSKGDQSINLETAAIGRHYLTIGTNNLPGSVPRGFALLVDYQSCLLNYLCAETPQTIKLNQVYKYSITNGQTLFFEFDLTEPTRFLSISIETPSSQIDGSRILQQAASYSYSFAPKYLFGEEQYRIITEVLPTKEGGNDLSVQVLVDPLPTQWLLFVELKDSEAEIEFQIQVDSVDFTPRTGLIPIKRTFVVEKEEIENEVNDDAVNQDNQPRNDADTRVFLFIGITVSVCGLLLLGSLVALIIWIKRSWKYVLLVKGGEQ